MRVRVPRKGEDTSKILSQTQHRYRSYHPLSDSPLLLSSNAIRVAKRKVLSLTLPSVNLKKFK